MRHAEHQAGHVLTALDAVARPRAETMALDEIFFRRQPCLVGVEPASMALLLCQRSADRTAATWKQALTPFTGLNYVCTDAGTGLQKALAAVAAECRQQDRPPLERGLDHFHTAQEAQRVLGRLWKRVEARWDEAEEADRKCRTLQSKGHDGRGPAARARVAWKRVADARAWYDGRAAAWQRARQALTLLGPDGQLNDRVQAERAIAAACVGLPGRPWKKVRAFSTDSRTLTFLERTQRQVAAAEPRGEVRAALVRLWGLERAAAACRPSPRCGGGAYLAAVVVQRVVCAKLAKDWPESYGRVRAVLAGAVRASTRRGVPEQRVADAAGTAAADESGDARPEAAVLELPPLPQRPPQGPLSLRVAGAGTADLRLLGSAPHGPRTTDSRTVNYRSCGVRQCQLSAISQTKALSHFWLTADG